VYLSERGAYTPKGKWYEEVRRRSQEDW
jgi:hypothetical protein